MIKLINPGLARIGKIVIGEKGPNHPVKFDHFVVKTLFRDQKGQLLVDQALMERLGEKPTSLKIRLPFNGVELNFPNSLRMYKGARLFCEGDGEQAQRLTGQAPTYGPAEPFGPCGEACPDFKARRCRPFGVLRCVLEEQQQIGGIYEWRTTSYNSIRNVLAALTMIKAQTGGQLAWIPLTMRLVPQTVTPREGSPNTAYIVQIVYEGSPQHLLTTVRDLLALRAPLIEEIRALETTLRALPPAEETSEEAKDIQEEFYPDNTEEVPADKASTPLPQPAPPAKTCAGFDPNRGWCTGAPGHAGGHVFGNSPVVVPPKADAPPGNPPPAGAPPSPSATPVDSSATGAVAGPPAAEAPKPAPPADGLPKSRGSLEAAAASLLKLMAPGDSAEAKTKRVELMQRCWKKKGWLEMTALPLSKFEAGLLTLQALSQPTSVEPSDDDDVPDFPPPDGEMPDGLYQAAEDEHQARVNNTDYTPPGETIVDVEVSPPEAPHTEESTTGQPGVSFATAQQIAGLKLTAQQVGGTAPSELQDVLDHYPKGVPTGTYVTMRTHLAGRKAEAKEGALI